MRIADTSALYALMASGDAHHAKAVAAMSQDDPVIIPAEIFAEMIGLTDHRIGFEEARAAGEYLRSLPHVRIEPSTKPVLESAWTHFKENRGKISMADSVVIAWCRASRAPAWSCDREVLRRAGVL